MNDRERAGMLALHIDKLIKSGQPYGDTDLAFVEKAFFDIRQEERNRAVGIYFKDPANFGPKCEVGRRMIYALLGEEE